MVTLFGTDGVRGVVNSTLMPELAFQLGRAAGAYFCREEGRNPSRAYRHGYKDFRNHGGSRFIGGAVRVGGECGLGRRDSHTGYRIPDTDRKL